MALHRASVTILASLVGLAGFPSAASAQDAQLFAELRGGAEVGTAGLATAGDPDARKRYRGA